MRDLDLGRLVRAIRRRRRLRQADCARRAGVHRSTWSRLERGQLHRLTIETLRRCLEAVEIRLELRPSWRGAELDRLLDEDHATLLSAWVGRLRRWGWDVRVEVSFNNFGDRGRIDFLAWHPATRVLVVGEVKSLVADAQGTLGPLDVKVRVARHLAESLGWMQPTRVLPLLIVRDSSTARDRLARVAPLFASFTVRGRSATTCLRRPELASGPMLILSDLRIDANRHVARLGSHRVSSRRPRGSSDRSASTYPAPGGTAEGA